VSQILDFIGHDGTEIWWPELPAPRSYQAFHIQEMIDFAWSRGYTVTQFDCSVESRPFGALIAKPVPCRDVKMYLEQSIGVVTTLGQHAWAWDGRFWDPDSEIYVQNVDFDTFFAIKSLP
jgi:hypothetical protein